VTLAEEELAPSLAQMDPATKKENVLAFLIVMKIVAKAAEDKKIADQADFKKKLDFARNRPSEADDEGVVKDDRVLEAWLADQGLLGRLPEFDLIYVNGPTSLGRLRRVNESWSVRLTEEEFFRQMFSSSPGL
jgi:hypothetical protein